jgi:peptide/nickel transport system substrate-binding protein
VTTTLPHPRSQRPSAGKHALLLLLGLCAFGALQSAAQADPARHAIAMHGDPAMPEGFAGMPYANADAPKGGRLVQGVLGTFDSLNPFIVKGIPVPSIRGYVTESLMARGYD